jgi:hypothetical protein
MPSISASSSAKSGDAGGGMFGPISVGGIGAAPMMAGTGGGMTQWMIPAALVAVVLVLLLRR